MNSDMLKITKSLSCDPLKINKYNKINSGYLSIPIKC